MSTSTGLAKAVTALDVLEASGFALAGLYPQAILPAGFTPTPVAAIFALYAAARTLPLAVFVLIAIFNKLRATLIVLGTLAGIIQFLDFFVGRASTMTAKSTAAGAGDLQAARSMCSTASLSAKDLRWAWFKARRPRPAA